MRKRNGELLLWDHSGRSWLAAARLPGEASTFKQKPSSAMASESGHCDKGGLHTWRFGRCTKCGLGEGTAAIQASNGLEGLAKLLKRWERASFPEMVDDFGHDFDQDHEGADERRPPRRPESAPRPRRSSSRELLAVDMVASKCMEVHTATRCSIKSKDIGLQQQGAAPLHGEQRRECHVCAHRWLDRHKKDECPKCLSCLSTFRRANQIVAPSLLAGEARRIHHVAAQLGAQAEGVNPVAPLQSDFKEPDLTDERRRAGTSKRSGGSGTRKLSTRKECPRCAHRWLDKWDKDECPRCLAQLSAPQWKAKTPQTPGSAIASYSGTCPRGGPHAWRLGRCRQCGQDEGRTKTQLPGRQKYPELFVARERKLMQFRSLSFLP